MRNTRVLGMRVVVLLLALVTAAPAAAQSSPPGPTDVVPGVAFAAADGTITFAGGGFAPHAPIRLALNGTPRGTAHTSATGAFSVPLKLTGVGAQSLSAAGRAPNGRVHVVTASVTLGSEALPSADPGTSTLRQVYDGLAEGLAAVVIGALLLLAARLMARRPAART